MPRIRCHYDECIYLEEGYCGAAAIELEPETGCLTFTRVDDAADTDEEWDEDEFEDEFEDEEEELYEDEDDEWEEDEDDDF